MQKKILTINPGSTSTKLAYFLDDNLVFEKNLDFPKPIVKGQVHVLDEFEARMKSILDFLEENSIKLEDIDIFVSRGGAPGRVEYGAYLIDKNVIQNLCFGTKPTYHASNLAPILAFALAKRAGTNRPAIFYDAVAADMAPPIAHISGIPGMERHVGCHNLNARMVAREAAQRIGKKYEESKLIVAHVGGGISVSAHNHGIIDDSVMCDEGPMSPQRAGRISFIAMIEMCFIQKKTMKEMQAITDQGGLLSFFQVPDMIELEKLVENGDAKAELYYKAMAYQVAKAVGEMYTVLDTEADAIVLTGGVSNSKMFTSWLAKKLKNIAPVIIIPGELEMLAMARGGLRVLNGEEEIKQYNDLPSGFTSMSDYIDYFKSQRPDLLTSDIVNEMITL